MKKIIAVTLGMLMLTSVFFVSVFGEDDITYADAKYIETYDFLSGLDIIPENTFADPGETVSIEEFSQWIVNARNGLDPYRVESFLTSPVTNDNAVRMLVTALGYGHVAQGQGGFPFGYISVAASRGIYKNVSAKGSADATRRDLTVMLYNAMTISLMQTRDIDGDPRHSQITANETLLSQLLDQKSVAIITGQIMSTNVSSLIGRSELPGYRNQVNIDGVVYDVDDNVDCTQLLGRVVTAFLHTDEYGIAKKLYKVTPKAGKNETMKLYAHDIVSYDNFTYEYGDRTKRTQKLTVNKNINVVYNGVGLSSVAAPDLEILNGTLTFLDSQGTGTYDILIIDEYSNYLVSAVDKQNEVITFRQNHYEEKWSMQIFSDEEDYTYYFISEKGDSFITKRYEKSDLDTISQNDIVSIFRSKDKKTVTLAVTDKVYEGFIEELNYNDGLVTVDGVEYSLFEYAVDIYLIPEGDLPMDKRVRLYADIYGQIVCADGNLELSEDSRSATGYAYVIDTKQKAGISGELQLRLLHGAIIRDKETDESKENDLSVVKDPNAAVLAEKQIYGQSVDAKTCAQNIRFTDGDGEEQRIASEQLLSRLKNKMIQYTLNDEGLVTRIKTFYGDASDRRYDDEVKTFYDRAPGGAFMVNENTIFIVAPTAAVNDEDFDVRFYIKDTASYRITPFDLQRSFNSDFEIASVCLIQSSANGNNPGLITNDTQISIVTRTTTAIDDNGEITTKVYAYTGGVLTSYLMRRDSYVPPAPRNGDIVKLSIDGGGAIDNYVLLMSGADESMPFFRIGARTNNERFYGRVYNKRQDILQALTGKVVKQIEVSYLDDYSEILTLDISTLLEKQIYLYKRSGEITLGSYNDILTELSSGDSASAVFLSIVAGNIRGMVIFK